MGFMPPSARMRQIVANQRTAMEVVPPTVVAEETLPVEDTVVPEVVVEPEAPVLETPVEIQAAEVLPEPETKEIQPEIPVPAPVAAPVEKTPSKKSKKKSSK